MTTLRISNCWNRARGGSEASGHTRAPPVYFESLRVARVAAIVSPGSTACTPPRPARTRTRARHLRWRRSVVRLLARGPGHAAARTGHAGADRARGGAAGRDGGCRTCARRLDPELVLEAWRGVARIPWEQEARRREEIAPTIDHRRVVTLFDAYGNERVITQPLPQSERFDPATIAPRKRANFEKNGSSATPTPSRTGR